MAAAPKSLMIRSYHVGFGDCFLLSFACGPRSERHVLIDFGSTGLPEGTPRTRMMDIAKGYQGTDRRQAGRYRRYSQAQRPHIGLRDQKRQGNK